MFDKLDKEDSQRGASNVIVRGRYQKRELSQAELSKILDIKRKSNAENMLADVCGKDYDIHIIDLFIQEHINKYENQAIYVPLLNEALFQAAIRNKHDVANLLLQAGADPNTLHVADNFYQSLLHFCIGEKLATAVELVKAGAKINTINTLNQSCFHHICATNSQELIQLCVERLEDIEFKDGNNLTPLAFTCECSLSGKNKKNIDYTPTISLLLAAGANPDNIPKKIQEILPENIQKLFRVHKEAQAMVGEILSQLAGSKSVSSQVLKTLRPILTQALSESSFFNTFLAEYSSRNKQVIKELCDHLDRMLNNRMVLEDNQIDKKEFSIYLQITLREFTFETTFEPQDIKIEKEEEENSNKNGAKPTPYITIGGKHVSFKPTTNNNNDNSQTPASYSSSVT